MQNPASINTKFAKEITAYFIGNSKDIYDNVLNWIEYLKTKGFTEQDPLFPVIESSFASDGTHILYLEKSTIKSQTTIRKIFEKAFKSNNLPYRKQHSFRHSIIRKANELDNSSMWISAFNQNFGEKTDSVIISSYGTFPEHKRCLVVKSFDLED